MTYRVLSLFAGIGGFDLGLERTGGFKTVAFCEIDPFCRRVLAKHWPEVPCYHDVRTLSGEQVGPVDVICGGFPCQDISFAGKGAGLAGERSGLWSEYARLIDELRPLYVIVENVAALLGRGLATVLGDLAAIGYDAEWHCIPASAVGAPHRRDRLWIVAYPSNRGQRPDGGLEQDTGQAGETKSEGHQRERLRALTGRGGEAVAHAECVEQRQDALPDRCATELGGSSPTERGESPSKATGRSGVLADAAGQRCGEAGQFRRNEPAQRSPRSSASFPDTDPLDAQGLVSRRDDTLIRREQIERQARLCRGAGSHQDWSIEPAVGRVAHGVPDRVGQLRAYGNAVVPQIPELIGRAILEAIAAESLAA